VSAYYLLASVDLVRNAHGGIERAPEGSRIYQDVLLRTLAISASVTLLCLAMGFPVALLLTQVRERTADWLLVLVLLPFWTSLLVRTASWVVVLQKEGMVNSLLLKLGLIADTSGQEYAMWFTHGTSHYIGLDVHDVGSRNEPLQAGMTFTIEPGLYIRQSVLDQLPKTTANLALIGKIQAAVTKYHDIGVRIEDSFVVEGAGVRSLSASLPRTVSDVESFMRTIRTPTGAR